MKGKQLIQIAIIGLVAMAVMACGGSSRGGKLQNSTDSLSYIIGMNIAYNIMEMDSTVNASQVMEGISDVLDGTPQISLEDGKFYLLSYMNYDVYERVKKYENQILEDIASSDKDIVRTRSG